MAKRKKARKSSAAKRCCMCPTTAARAAISAAKTEAKRTGSCGPVRSALDRFNAAAEAELPMLKPGARNLLKREATKKALDVGFFCQDLEAREGARFSGLFGLGLFGL